MIRLMIFTLDHGSRRNKPEVSRLVGVCLYVRRPSPVDRSKLEAFLRAVQRCAPLHLETILPVFVPQLPQRQP